MSELYNMEIISLGGVGGCFLAEALRKLNKYTFPYDWLITNQSFILESFNLFDKFFSFENKYVYKTHFLLHPKKNAIMLHDFKNFSKEKDNVILKYKRRFDRLNNILNTCKNILFIRILDNLQDKLVPNNFYDNIYNREVENINKWNTFILELNNRYNSNHKLLIITNDKKINYIKSNNLIIHITNKHTDTDYLQKIIQETILKK